MATRLPIEQPAGLDQNDVVMTAYGPGDGLPVFVQPRNTKLRDDFDAARSWFVSHQGTFDELIARHGALVFRGFPIRDTDAFAAMTAHYESPPFGYTAGSSPRERISAHVYEATHTPAEDVIMMHQEMAYLPNYPSRIVFFCRIPAASGGETFLADMRRVTAALPPAFVEEIERRGVRYGRNFRDMTVSTNDVWLDAVHRSWQAAFNTTDRSKPIADCEAMGLQAEWLEDGSLSSSYTSRGLIDHPSTGERLWFNQIATTVLGPENIGPRFPFYDSFYGAEKPRPYETTYGDGGAIPRPYLEVLYKTLNVLTVAFPWSSGDLLLIDNYVTSHGRNAYTGLRDVQVALLK
jgi:alpha-ketoglutarate-dependent taurine dioxygenase